jgi:hypothetical protein
MPPIMPSAASHCPRRSHFSTGLLRLEDVAAFGKANDVRVMLTANKETHPNQVVIEATLPDGNRVGALMDGSVVQLPR